MISVFEQEVRGKTLESAAERLEQLAGNHLYQKAWRAAAKILRGMKHEEVNRQPKEVK